MISVIIPTYKSPTALDLCLRSAIEGQTQPNEIIVVVDGFYDLNREVLEKHSDKISILNLETNQGLCRATNLGVYNASNKLILIVNDDNVFPNKWDEKLLKLDISQNQVISPNQIEPYDSMFKQFHIKDLGRDPENFNLKSFWEYEESMSKPSLTLEGSTLPIFMYKIDYIKLGGWDENYDLGVVADWDFFLKCNLSHMALGRTYNCNFYHFVSLSTNNTEEKKLKRQQAEKTGHEYAKYKWGSYIYHNPENNSKFLK